MPDRLTLRRATRKLLRPLRKLLRGRGRRFDLAEMRGPVLAVVAHPDDEVFCSGLICALLDAGTEVRLLCMTRGEGGERAGGAAGELGAVREREMVDAARALGIGEVAFMDYVDPVAAGGQLRAPQVDSQTLTAQLVEAILAAGANSVITHGSSGEYWHPAHLCLHDGVRAAARDIGGVQVWTFNAWADQHPLSDVLNRDDPAQLFVDATPFHERRLASLGRHASQRAVFERFAGSDLETFVRKTAREGYHLAVG